ncbi:Cysteine dioxygenase [Penicillium hetheringtonii]|uniref:Cysteine dioxygenase n=1 Tax=Penicillium hetheringtonii TaxID=911720 RepID=A0AAD6DRB0_9EURO|nr:Cysteine dioxygenase [Penicillium hetheringtonii]
MLSTTLSPSLPLDKGFSPSYHHFKERYNLESLVQDVKKAPRRDGCDWIDYFHNDTSKNYTRNAIENINHKANILLLVWNPGKGSPIHDHANAHCIMKVLAGQLHETVYHSPDSNSGEEKPLEIKSSNTFGMNEVTYISDDIGLHRVHNPSDKHVAVSLHHYGYNIFNEETGSASFVPQAHSVSRS